ncbi:MAG: ribosome silencing factor, partial [Pseudomonadota bacterium]
MNSKEKALLCAGVACDKQALDLVVLEVKDISSFADYFIICSGTSTRQVQAIAEHLEVSLKEKGIRVLGKEGMQGGRWVLLDYADVIIHVFHTEERE